MRIPQSKQSAPSSHTPYSEPSPPSSHSPSLPYAVQLLVHRPSTSRGPQSMQSLPSGHAEYSAPSPPSSQSPSLLNPRVAQSSWHAVKFSAAESTAERSSAARMSEVAKCSRGAWGYGETQRVVPRVGAIRYFVLVLYRIAQRWARPVNGTLPAAREYQFATQTPFGCKFATHKIVRPHQYRN